MTEAPAGRAEFPICSAKGCRAEAIWVLAWNNPTLHTPERRKTWAACEVHREFLTDFLTARGFLRETLPVSPVGAGQEPGAPSAADG